VCDEVIAVNPDPTDIRILGVALDDLDEESFREHVRGALDEFARRGVPEEEWERFSNRCSCFDQAGGPEALGRTVRMPEERLGPDTARLHT
jgi:hypothetical protein